MKSCEIKKSYNRLIKSDDSNNGDNDIVKKTYSSFCPTSWAITE